MYENNDVRPLVSLIIPVYNVEKYLRKALSSVENQTLKDIEVIIVNDGSTDRSPLIIEEFSERNSNFIVINQENKGLSGARNAGISISKGEYIAFMDSDDFVSPDFLQSLYQSAIENQADIVCCNYNIYYPQLDLSIYMPFTSLPGIYSNSKALKKLILDMGVHYFAWNKLCKRSLFFDNQIKFYDMYFEDVATSPRLFYYAKKVVLLGRALYNYTSRESSILNTVSLRKINDFIKSLGVIRNFLEKERSYNKYKGHVWVYSQRAKLVSYYLILQLHMDAMNFDGFLENISAAKRSIDYIAGNNYRICRSDVPELPYLVKAPAKKVKIRKRKKNKKSAKLD